MNAVAKSIGLAESLPSLGKRWLGRRFAPLVIYPLLALLAFPTVEILFARSGAWTYTHDVFDDGGGLPRLAIAVRDWSANGPTLWDAYLTGGNALLGQFALPPYAPDVALAFLVGPFWAYAIWGWVVASAAGIGMHLFLRDSVRLVPVAVVMGSIAAVFCFWHPIYGISVAIFPTLLWLADGATRRDARRRWFVAGAIGAAVLALYAGQLQIVILAAAIQLAWLLIVREGPRRSVTGVWFAIWALAFGTYAPVLITQLVMLPISERSIWNLVYLYGTGIENAVSLALSQVRGLLLAIPVGPGLPLGDPRYGTLFLGGIGLALVIFGVLAGRRDRAGVFLVGLLLAIPFLDVAAHLAAPLQEHLGFLRSFQFVRIRHFLPFALAAVAALGMHAVLTGALATHRWRRWAAVVAAAALGLVAAQAAIGATHAAGRLHRITATPSDLGWLLATAGLAVGLVGGLLLVVGIPRPKAHQARAFGFALVILLAADRALLASGTPLLGPYIDTYRARLGLSSGQAFLLRQPGIAHQRVLTFGDHANRMAFRGLRQADGYQAIYPVAYHGFFGALTAPGLAILRYEYFHGWGARAYAFEPQVDPELVSLVGARWLYVRGDRLPTVGGLVERFRNGEVTVYENPDAFPRAFVAGAARLGRDTPAVLQDLAHASLADLRGTVYTTAEQGAALGATLPAADSDGRELGTPEPAGLATITLDKPDRVEIEVRATRPAVLVLTDTVAPGWVAELDGQPATIQVVDAAFRGIAIDPSAHHVVFRYEPVFTKVGFTVAGLSLAAAVLWWWSIDRWRPSWLASGQLRRRD